MQALVYWAGGVVPVPVASTTVDELHQRFVQQLGVCAEARFRFTLDGRPLYDHEALDLDGSATAPILRAIPVGGLQGGKGGFGANLRSEGKSGAKKPTLSFGMCRDLSGRRLQSVNNEIRLRKWLSDKEKEKRRLLGEHYREPDTPSGIPGWHLAVPSWAEGVKGGRGGGSDLLPGEGAGGTGGRRANYKMDMCHNWLEARRAGRRPPPGAPAWWGCVKGRVCTFAHGEAELRGNAKSAAADARREADRARVDAAVHSYAKDVFLYAPQGDEDGSGGADSSAGGGRSMLTSVLQGMKSAGGAASVAPQPAARKRGREEGVADSSAVVADGGPRMVDPPARSWDSAHWLVQIPFEREELESAATGAPAAPPAAGPAARTTASAAAQRGKGSSWAALPEDYGSSDDSSSDSDSDSSNSDAAPVGFGASVSYRRDAAALATASAASPASAGVAVASGMGNFTTLAVAGVSLPAPTLALPKESQSQQPGTTHYHYTVTLEALPEGAAVQLGWAVEGAFTADLLELISGDSEDSDGSGAGVGDTDSSWGFDGGRQLRFHGGSEEAYGSAMGRQWRQGAVVGCVLSVGADGGASMSFTVDGANAGEAFSLPPGTLTAGAVRLYPAISIDSGVRVAVDIGGPAPMGRAPVASSSSSSSSSSSAASGRWVSVLTAVAEAAAAEARALRAVVKLARVEAPPAAAASAPAAAGAAPVSSAPTLPAPSASGSDEAEINIDDDAADGGSPGAAPAPVAAPLLPDGQLDLQAADSPAQLLPLGLERLKTELADRGLKTGGSLAERAERLFAVKGLIRDQVPAKLRGPGFPGPKL